MTRAVCYARFSTDRQAKGKSIAAQIAQAADYAKRHGLIFRDELKFCDEALSGADESRPALLELLAAAARKEFDIVIAEDSSRIGRDVYLYHFVKRELAKHGVRLVYVSENFTDDPQGEFMETVIAGVNQLYRRLTAQKVRRHMRAIAERGYVPGGLAPFGLRLKRVDIGGGKTAVTYEHDPETIEHARDIFRWWLNGWTLREISCELAKREIRMPANSVLSWIYDNAETFAGKVIYGRTAPHDGSRGVRQARENWEFFDGKHQPIITMDEAKTAIARMCRGQRKPYVHRNAHFLLSSVLQCTECGCSMHSHTDRQGRGYYRCYNRVADQCANRTYWNRDLVEKEVCRNVVEKIISQETAESLLAELTEMVERQSGQPSTVEAMHRDLLAIRAKAQNRLDNLLRAVADGTVDGPTVKAKIGEQKAVLAECGSSIDFLSGLNACAASLPTASVVGKIFGEWRERIVRPANREETRRLLRQTVRSVKLSKNGGLTIESDLFNVLGAADSRLNLCSANVREISGGSDGARTRNLCRDRAAL